MNAFKIAVPAILLLGVGSLGAEPEKPDPARQAEAVRAVRVALEDLPPGKETEQIREAIEKVRLRLVEDFKTLVKKAEADLDIARDRAAWSNRMLKAGYLTPGEAVLSRMKVEDAEHAVRKAQDRINLLNDDAIKAALAQRRKDRAAELRDRVRLVEADIELWKDRAAWSDRMVRKGYLSANQAKADQIRLERAEESLRQLQEQLKFLTEEPKKDADKPRDK